MMMTILAKDFSKEILALATLQLEPEEMLALAELLGGS